jgi:putative endonuclease
MFYVYILRSIPTGRFYTGSTQNIAARLEKHNAGHSAATRAYRPWELVYCECFDTRREALRREYEIKRQKSRAFIEALIA